MSGLLLPAQLQAQIAREAKAASPGECCGLLEGVRDGDRYVVTALHPARNLSAETQRFEVDPADHFRALRDARARGTAIVGCYHSHPAGRAEPSAQDRAGAAEAGFVWLIAAPAAADSVAVAAFLFDGSGFSVLPLDAPGSLDPPASSIV